MCCMIKLDAHTVPVVLNHVCNIKAHGTAVVYTDNPSLHRLSQLLVESPCSILCGYRATARDVTDVTSPIETNANSLPHGKI